jgi:hypothetical protein
MSDTVKSDRFHNGGTTATADRLRLCDTGETGYFGEVIVGERTGLSFRCVL